MSKKLTLNLKDWRKVKEDKDRTTMEHKAGHQLTLAHAQLSPENRKALSKLATAEAPPRQEDASGVQSMSQHRAEQTASPMMAKGGQVQYFADKGEVEDPTDTVFTPKVKPSPTIAHSIDPANLPATLPGSYEMPSPTPSVTPSPAPQLPSAAISKPSPSPSPEKYPAMEAKGGMIKNYADGTPDETVQPTEEAPPSVDVDLNAKLPDSTLNPNAAPAPQPTPAQAIAPEQAQEAPSAAAPPQQQPAATQAPAAQAPQQYAATEDSDGKPMEITGRLPSAASASPQPSDIVQHKNDTHEELSAQDKAWQEDLANQHITPQTYGSMFANKSTLGKIGMIFGLALGNAGAAMAGQPNILLGTMQKQIDNDLEAQKASKNNAQNFLRLNQQGYLNEATINHLVQEGKLNVAQAKALNVETGLKSYALARMQMNRAALHTLADQVQQLPLGTPQRQAAENTLAMLHQSVNNDNYDLADRASSASALANFGGAGGSGNPEQQFQAQNMMLRMSGNEKLAQDREDKHIPGIPGRASVPLTPADRDQVNSGIAFDQKLNRFIDWTSKHSGDLSPKDVNEGRALSAELQGAYRQATHGGVYKEGEQNFIGKIIDSEPTKFFNQIRVIPQLKAVAGENKARLDQILQSKGFQGYPGAARQAQQQPQATTASPKQSNQITYPNGMTFVRGPKGEAIRIK